MVCIFFVKNVEKPYPTNDNTTITWKSTQTPETLLLCSLCKSPSTSISPTHYWQSILQQFLPFRWSALGWPTPLIRMQWMCTILRPEWRRLLYLVDMVPKSLIGGTWFSQMCYLKFSWNLAGFLLGELLESSCCESKNLGSLLPPGLWKLRLLWEET